MKHLRIFLLASSMAVTSTLYAISPSADAQLNRICSAIETIASTNGIDLKVSGSISETTLSILAEMTDEDDSIDYIAGYVSRPAALTMLAPVFAPILAANEDIQDVSVKLTDLNEQFMDYKFTSGEILDYYNR